MLPLLVPILGNILGRVGDHFADKRAEKRSETQAKIDVRQAQVTATIKAAEAGQLAEIQWDQIAQANSGRSWKDEYWTIILSIPLILCFVPGFAGYITEGFEALEKTPEYYRAAVGVAIAASFGMRSLVKSFAQKKAAK